MQDNREIFNYTYSASEQQEIKNIREKYAPPTEREDKMERLRKLDASVTKPGMIISLTVGIISVLIFGLGMSCVMVWEGLFVQGIIIGVIGIAGMISAYPVYNGITKKRRKKLAPEIMKLTDELMK